MSLFRFKWPWDHSDAARHLDEVAKRQETVERTVKQVRQIKDPLGEAVARALEGRERHS